VGSGGRVDTEFLEKASQYTIVVDTSGNKKKIVGYASLRKKNPIIYPIEGTKAFLHEVTQSFFAKRPKSDMLIFLARHKGLETIWSVFFEKNPNVRYVDAKSLATTGDESEKEFKLGLNNVTLSRIYELLKKENYFYLHAANEEGTIYDILLLTNRETNTYSFLGQVGNKDIFMFVVNAIDMSPNARLKEWFLEITELGRGAFRNKQHVVEVLLGIIGPMKEYRIEDIMTMTNNPDKPNYNYLDLGIYEKLPDIPTPAWDEFIQLFACEEKSELFRAWVYSIFLAVNKGRQWLWIQGSGSDGKSSVVNAIQKYMDQYFGKGKSYHTAAHDAFKNQFFGSNVYNKRLLIFGDNRDRSLFKVARYLGISGGDHMSIEFKYGHAFSARVYTKILVISNFDPYINFTLAAETSRAIVLNLDPAACAHAKRTRKEESSYEERLVQEFPTFMKSCKASYYRCVKPGSYDLIIPPKIVAEMKATCASNDYTMIQYFLHCCLEYSPKYRVRVSTLVEQFKFFCDEHLKGIDFHIFSGTLKNELTHERYCKYVYQPGPSGIETQYVLGCKLKDIQPKSYATVLRDEDALDRMHSNHPPEGSQDLTGAEEFLI
jgi:hypothetical protein